MNYQYTELLSSLLLAYYFGSDSDVAIRQCAKRIGKRLTDKHVLNIVKRFREAKSPLNELQDAVNQIEEHYTIQEFMRLGVLCGQPSAAVVN